MARPRIRNTSHQFPIVTPWTNVGWRVTRLTDFAEAEARAERGELRRLFDPKTGALAAYEVLEVPKSLTDHPSDPTRAALGVQEMHALAGLMGRSRTMRLDEKTKLERVKSGMLRSEEDFVEKVHNLVDAYLRSANFAKTKGRRPGDRACRVYPREAATT